MKNLHLLISKRNIKALLFIGLVVFASTAYGQEFNLDQGVQEANTQVRSLIPNIKYLLWGIAGIIAIFGSIKVYSKFQNQDSDVNKAIGTYVFAFVFLMGAGFLIDTAFGL